MSWSIDSGCILLAITFELDFFSLKINIHKVGLGIEHGG